MQEGGYNNAKYWEAEGNKWREYTKAQYPVFWIKKGDDYLYRSMLEEHPLPLDWPVDVNYHEAKAFCNYLSEKNG